MSNHGDTTTLLGHSTSCGSTAFDRAPAGMCSFGPDGRSEVQVDADPLNGRRGCWLDFDAFFGGPAMSGVGEQPCAVVRLMCCVFLERSDSFDESVGVDRFAVGPVAPHVESVEVFSGGLEVFG